MADAPEQTRADVLSPNPHLTQWDRHWIDALVVLAVAFAVLPAGFNWSYADDAESLSKGSLGFQLQWGGLLLVSLYLALRHPARTWQLMRLQNPFLLILCGYAFLGLAWSPAPVSTLKKSVQFFELILMACVVQLDGRRWTHHCSLIAYLLVAILAVSAFVSLAIPSVGIDAYFGYAWRGVLVNKNTLGGIAAVTAVYWVGLWHADALPPRGRWWGLLLAVACVVLSTSSTSFLMMCVGLGVFWLLQRQHIASPLWLVRVAVAVGIVVLLGVHLFYVVKGAFPSRVDLAGPVAALFGKGADLTGRSDIWEPLMREIGQHALLGVGYGAFWLGPGSASQPVLDALTWVPFQGHNNYLDVVNELGAVGGVLWLGATLLIVRRLFQMTAYDRSGAAMYGALLVPMYLSGLSETSLFRSMIPQFLLYMLINASLASSLMWRREAQALRDHQARQRRAAPSAAPPVWGPERASPAVSVRSR